MSVTTVIKNACSGQHGEGPHWDEATQCLLYVDLLAGDVHRWNSVTGQDEVTHFDEPTTLVVPATSGGYVIGLGRKLVKMDWSSGNITKQYGEIDQDCPKNRFNDGKCDQSGRLWAGTMGPETAQGAIELGQGSLYSLGKDECIKKHLSGLDIANGLAWTADDKIMYFVDSIPRKVYAFDFDIESGTISNQRVAISFTPGTEKEDGLPDGMTIDTDGKLWIACFFGSKVACFDPETGQEIRSIKVPASRITSCCFGGPNYDELYVTSSRLGAGEKELASTPLAGSVFKITGLGAKGTAPTQFAG